MPNAKNHKDPNTLTAPNKAHWDERVAHHLVSEMYNLDYLREGNAKLHPFEVEELGDITGLDVFHPQCHFGNDSFTLAQMGAKSVLGLDFSPKAIDAAHDIAAELGLGERVKFVLSSIDDGRAHVPAASFDLAFVTWGTITWLPNLQVWADLIAHALRPGGRLYFADIHPTALIFDDDKKLPDGRPGYFIPYFHEGPYEIVDATDYANPDAVLENTLNVEFMHTLADIVTALMNAGLQLVFLREHNIIAWQAFSCLEPRGDRFYHWPDKAWLPLTLSIMAKKT